jgi:hypothetical protein
MGGKKKMEGNLLLSPGTNEIKLQLGAFSSGNYLLRINIDGKNSTRQFLVQ